VIAIPSAPPDTGEEVSVWSFALKTNKLPKASVAYTLGMRTAEGTGVGVGEGAAAVLECAEIPPHPDSSVSSHRLIINKAIDLNWQKNLSILRDDWAIGVPKRISQCTHDEAAATLLRSLLK
jgi:hypothetical protein